MTRASKAFLAEALGGARVTFDFNPTSLSIIRGSHSSRARFDEDRPKVSEMQYEITTWDPTQLKLNQVVFEGASTQGKVDQLQRWLEPDWSRPSTRASSGPAYGPPPRDPPAEVNTRKVWLLPELKFIWGSRGLNERVELQNLDVKYTRFAPDGLPVRAEVSITLHAMHMRLTGTNPTSGGLPGRQATALVEGQNLQTLALDTYGSPAHWRKVAALNGVEDPLRLRPGTVVYLPDRAELDGGYPG
jgi:hypothetical protein